MYYVIGGEYTGTDFKTFADGAGEKYGPFETYKEAKEIWTKHAWLTVDNCLCRYKIEEQ